MKQQNYSYCSETCTDIELIEQGLTSHQTHYRLYWRRVFMGRMT